MDAYQLVIDNYPTSSVAANAQYQIGYAWMKSSQTGDYDLGSAKRATDAFQDYLVRYPNSDKAVQAQDNIRRLGQTQTKGAYDIAKFYETQHNPRAAFIYYNEVVREDPNSPTSQIAKKRIQELRPAVEALPGGIGPDGSGNPAIPPPPKVASGPPAPGTGPEAVPAPEPPMPNTAPPDAASNTLPADPNAPVSSSSPGETAADQTATPASAPASTNAAPPVAAPPDKTPLPQ